MQEGLSAGGGGAEVGDHAVRAAGPAGDADLPAVGDQEVREQGPVVPREERHEVLFDTSRIVVLGETEKP